MNGFQDPTRRLYFHPQRAYAALSAPLSVPEAFIAPRTTLARTAGGLLAKIIVPLLSVVLVTHGTTSLIEEFVRQGERNAVLPHRLGSWRNCSDRNAGYYDAKVAREGVRETRTITAVEVTTTTTTFAEESRKEEQGKGRGWGFLDRAVNGVKQAMGKGKEQVTSKAKEVEEAAGTKGQEAKKTLTSQEQSAKSTTASKAKQAPEVKDEATTKEKQVKGTTKSDIKDAASSEGMRAKDQATSKLNSAKDAATSKLKSAKDAVTSKAKSAEDAATLKAKDAVESKIKSAKDKATPTAKEAVKPKAESAKDKMTSTAKGAVKPKVESAKNKMTSMAKEAVQYKVPSGKGETTTKTQDSVSVKSKPSSAKDKTSTKAEDAQMSFVTSYPQAMAKARGMGRAISDWVFNFYGQSPKTLTASEAQTVASDKSSPSEPTSSFFEKPAPPATESAVSTNGSFWSHFWGPPQPVGFEAGEASTVDPKAAPEAAQAAQAARAAPTGKSFFENLRDLARDAKDGSKFVFGHIITAFINLLQLIFGTILSVFYGIGRLLSSIRRFLDVIFISIALRLSDFGNSLQLFFEWVLSGFQSLVPDHMFSSGSNASSPAAVAPGAVLHVEQSVRRVYEQFTHVVLSRAMRFFTAPTAISLPPPEGNVETLLTAYEVFRNDCGRLFEETGFTEPYMRSYDARYRRHNSHPHVVTLAHIDPNASALLGPLHAFCHRHHVLGLRFKQAVRDLQDARLAFLYDNSKLGASAVAVLAPGLTLGPDTWAPLSRREANTLKLAWWSNSTSLRRGKTSASHLPAAYRPGFPIADAAFRWKPRTADEFTLAVLFDAGAPTASRMLEGAALVLDRVLRDWAAYFESTDGIRRIAESWNSYSVRSAEPCAPVSPVPKLMTRYERQLCALMNLHRGWQICGPPLNRKKGLYVPEGREEFENLLKMADQIGNRVKWIGDMFAGQVVDKLEEGRKSGDELRAAMAQVAVDRDMILGNETDHLVQFFRNDMRLLRKDKKREAAVDTKVTLADPKVLVDTLKKTFECFSQNGMAQAAVCT